MPISRPIGMGMQKYSNHLDTDRGVIRSFDRKPCAIWCFLVAERAGDTGDGSHEGPVVTRHPCGTRRREDSIAYERSRKEIDTPRQSSSYVSQLCSHSFSSPCTATRR